MKINHLILVVASALLIAGCESQPQATEKAPPAKQEVVMVPAQGQGAQNSGATATAPTGPSSTATPDGKQPGDR